MKGLRNEFSGVKTDFPSMGMTRDHWPQREISRQTLGCCQQTKLSLAFNYTSSV